MVEDNIGVEDKIGKAMKEKQITNLNAEKEQFEKRVEQLDRNLENYVPQWEIDNGMWQLQLSDNNHIKKEEHRIFPYEEKPEYWDFVKKKLEYKYRQDKHLAEEKINTWEREKEIIQEELDRINAKLLELTGETNE